VPRLVEALVEKVIGAAAGANHSAVWTEEGELFTFGVGDDGRLATERRRRPRQPVPEAPPPLNARRSAGSMLPLGGAVPCRWGRGRLESRSVMGSLLQQWPWGSAGVWGPQGTPLAVGA